MCSTGGIVALARFRGLRTQEFPRDVFQIRHVLGATQAVRMAFSGKIDKTLDPVDVRLLDASAVVLPENRIAYLIEQERHGGCRRNGFCMIPLHAAGNVLSKEADDMNTLQKGGLRSACFHT
jgi:hypothetical protein